MAPILRKRRLSDVDWETLRANKHTLRIDSLEPLLSELDKPVEIGVVLDSCEEIWFTSYRELCEFFFDQGFLEAVVNGERS